MGSTNCGSLIEGLPGNMQWMHTYELSLTYWGRDHGSVKSIHMAYKKSHVQSWPLPLKGIRWCEKPQTVKSCCQSKKTINQYKATSCAYLKENIDTQRQLTWQTQLSEENSEHLQATQSNILHISLWYNKNHHRKTRCCTMQPGCHFFTSAFSSIHHAIKGIRE